jgi:penicillin-binding protein 1A
VYVTLLVSLQLCLLAAVTTAAIQWYFIPQLPPIDRLKEARLQVPLQIYTKDGVFIAEYGEQRRIPTTVSQVPEQLIKAILAAEDDRFYEHPGVNLKSLFRAAFSFIKTGEKRQGGSTITMQVARNFFLTPDKTIKRKFDEILLSLKIEEELTKNEILELYLNKIYFGHRAYGINAGAEVYYGKKLDQLNLAQWAMLAGLPKAPSTNNPITNPQRAKERRNYVLGRMLALSYISKAEYQEALNAPLTARLYKRLPEIDALYIAEMVRSYLLEKLGEDAVYTNGYKVFTTIDSRLQEIATMALRRNLFRYDKRHGFKGAIDHVEIPKGVKVNEWADNILDNYPLVGPLVPSIVLRVRRRSIIAYNDQAGEFKIRWSDISWARQYINDNRRGRYPKSARRVVKRGDIIMAKPHLDNQQWYRKTSEKKGLKKVTYKLQPSDNAVSPPEIRWSLSQIPEVEGAFVALNPKDGAIQALVGGFDFYKSKFNRVTQAQRQPGSAFKPFIYSAALNKGYSRYSPINDAPIVFKVGDEMWSPRNYSHEYYGWTTLGKALAHSYNVSSVRLLDKVGVDYAINHLSKFGFEPERIPKNLTIVLGTGEVTPLDLTSGYSVFANNGFQVKPYFIDHIENSEGTAIFSANPLRICRNCPREVLATSGDTPSSILVPHTLCTQTFRYAPRVINSSNASTITSMLKDVIRTGTGRAALVLDRKNIAGKTGTTNDQRDAWFSGYSSHDLVATAWVGFDIPRSLGNKETGGNTALPMWIEFMGNVLMDSDESKPFEYDYVAKIDEPTSPRSNTTPSRQSSSSSGATKKKRRVRVRQPSAKRSRSSSPSASGNRRNPSASDNRSNRPKKATVIDEQLF